MPVDLTTLPQALKRKRAPTLKWWVVFLVLFISLSAFINIAIWPSEKKSFDIFFWHYVLTIPFFISLFLLTMRWFYYLTSEFISEAWNNSRECDLSNEIKRGSRTIVLAGYDVYLPHLITSVRLSEQFLLPDGIILPVVVNDKNKTVTHQAKFYDHGKDFFVRATEKITHLLSNISIQSDFSQHNKHTSISVVINTTVLSSLNEKEITALRSNVISSLPSVSSVNFTANYSLADIDFWLDHPESTDVLLLLSVNLKEFLDDGDAEAAVALLLYSSSCADKYKISGAKIHRPELNDDISSIKDVVSKALLWGGVSHDDIASVWLTGMGVDHKYSSFLSSHNLIFPKAEKNAESVIIDMKSGYTENIAPWLAIILAAENSCGDYHPQLIMSMPDKNSPPWWFVVHPSGTR
ncbi:MAG: hypothetical protein XXXJIFNMEKO3_02711 [Candidatus Erwinia impunctatus]|nr:hypothetical protein XXXJIFNMEKO_02711 [Culicoides impunctatus]